jgi:hypothetical protein
MLDLVAPMNETLPLDVITITNLSSPQANVAATLR